MMPTLSFFINLLQMAVPMITVNSKSCFPNYIAKLHDVFHTLLHVLCFLCLFVADQVNSFHPCLSRTAIIAARMSFQVCCFIITSFGNMQPSQHMCMNALVSCHFSSLNQ